MQINTEDVIKSSVKYRYTYRKTAVVSQIILFLVLSVSSVILFVNYTLPINVSKYSSQYDFEKFLKSVFLILSILFFILSIVALIKIPAFKKSFLCITEKGIYGAGGKALYFATQPFTIPIDQITGIEEDGNRIIIESGGNRYICLIRKPLDAKLKVSMLIKENAAYNEFLDQLFKNDRIQTVKPTPNTISSTNICSQCGTKNSVNNKHCYHCGNALNKDDN